MVVIKEAGQVQANYTYAYSSLCVHTSLSYKHGRLGATGTSVEHMFRQV